MTRDWQCLSSTPVDSPEKLQSLPQPFNSSCLSHVFSYIAQEVAERLQRSHHFPVNQDSNSDGTLVIRVVEPEYGQIITIEPLSAQELKVLQLIVDGYKNATIAGKLYITENTVHSHVRNILKKLDVSDRTEAAIWALRSGLVH